MGDLNELLGIDMTNLDQQLACALVHNDDVLIRSLTKCRTQQELTLAEVASRMGTTPDKVAAFERMDSDPRLSTVRRYALAVGARLTTTVTGTQDTAGATDGRTT